MFGTQTLKIAWEFSPRTYICKNEAYTVSARRTRCCLRSTQRAPEVHTMPASVPGVHTAENYSSRLPRDPGSNQDPYPPAFRKTFINFSARESHQSVETELINDLTLPAFGIIFVGGPRPPGTPPTQRTGPGDLTAMTADGCGSDAIGSSSAEKTGAQHTGMT